MKWILLVIFMTSHDGGSDIDVFRFYTKTNCIHVKRIIEKEMANKWNPHRGGMLLVSDCFKDYKY